MEVETFTTRRISERRNADVEEKNTVDDVESLSNGSVAGESKSSGTDGEKESSSVSSSNTPTSTSGQASSTGLDGMVVNRNEDRGINSARYCFFFILLVASVAIGTTVYMVTSNEEKQDYQADFENTAQEVADSTNENIHEVFKALEELSLMTTTFIQQQLKTEPEYPAGFVTIPDAEHHLGNARETAGAYSLGYLPVVEEGQYELWERYAIDHKGWMAKSWVVNPTSDVEAAGQPAFGENTSLLFPRIWTSAMYDEDGNRVIFDSSSCGKADQKAPTLVEQVPEDESKGPASPIWIVSPPPNPALPSRGNFNVRSDPAFQEVIQSIEEWRSPTFHDFCSTSKLFDVTASAKGDDRVDTMVVAPVFESFEENAPIVGHYYAMVPWYVYFQDDLQQGTDPVHAHVTTSCGNTFVIEIEGRNSQSTDNDNSDGNTEASSKAFIDQAGHHEEHSPVLTNIAIESQLAAFAHSACNYTLLVYPSATFYESHVTNAPVYYTVVVLTVFLCTSLAFLLFDCLVQQRQKTLLVTAQKQNAIISSIFPKAIQKKLMQDLDNEEKTSKLPRFNKSGTAGLRTYLNDDGMGIGESGVEKSKPIADLFPDTTVMFADIAGFTAWSSTREPSQVFQLLETLYNEFDSIAKRRRIFKVEVVGDCYVAVCGLPDPRKNHAVAIGKFANECLTKMSDLTRQLAVELGPDTVDLGLRIGMHSGPVVAGVLRGDKSRFQLFGDTMNTASRMESTGIPNRIQVSEKTGELLKEAGKDYWLVAREEKVQAKGKGELVTFFLDLNGNDGASSTGSQVSEEDYFASARVQLDMVASEEKRMKGAEWTVEVMANLLKSMIASRAARKVKRDAPVIIQNLETESLLRQNGDVIEEVAECIILPDFTGVDSLAKPDETLDPTVLEELRSYIQTISCLYNNSNSFHCFEHANHVVQSVNKLLSRIVAPDLDAASEQNLHDYTFGITSDPLTWFAVVFSALIHDVDHMGLPNSTLVEERSPVAELYKGKSVAEQNSFDIAWDLLMEPTYANLRSQIYVSASEFKRFRQLVVNSVLATDIVDKHLKELRNDRWAKAFDPQQEITGRGNPMKATIVIEHLIQASDVAHTMQHWHIYRRWNENFFMECYQAYQNGHGTRGGNPADNWYKGELGFFDFYIIPLAQKLKECGVFGVSSDEYLSYALQNRKEWEARGESIVEEMLKKVEAKSKDDNGGGIQAMVMKRRLEKKMKREKLAAESEERMVAAQTA